ncbi:RNA polymerase sigma factor SigJ [Piscibacillus salipiscarius]|uniref:RNA polymerase sigma factor SigJ n=1 Tax=Piscibacillus salipiscarius TaxID=299480 RepID=A0ABW5QEJ5_9BACI|nr:RNA polymerase sigma factor SigJ [Piscibacillus salipiscarius]
MKDFYNQYRNLLFALAYQLTGSVEDAEDAVHDVFVKASDIQLNQLEEPKAYLCKMVTNRCLNLLKSARKRREVYIGQWLPEPIRTQDKDSTEKKVVYKDLLSYAMMVMVERLTPTERAVFVLREALDFEYSKIAEVLDKQEANCRKLMSRAKRKLGILSDGEEMIDIEDVGSDKVNEFLKALEEGNIDHLLTMLADDVVIESDGGGKAVAAKHPIKFPNQVVNFLHGTMKGIESYYDGNYNFEVAPINGGRGVLLHTTDGTVATLFLHQRHGKIAKIYVMRNPEKLDYV